MSFRSKFFQNPIKNKIPLYTSEDYMDSDTDSEIDDDYGHFCNENDDPFQTTTVVWKQYDDSSHLRLLQKHYNNYREYKRNYPIDSDYTSDDDSMNEPQKPNFRNTIYISMLRIVYCMFSYITLFMYRMKY